MTSKIRVSQGGSADALGMPDYFARLVRFFGRAKYDDFHLALSRGRNTHKIAYAVAHGAARFRPTAFLVALILYLLLPGLRIFPDADVIFSGDTKNNRRALDEVAALLAHRDDLRLGTAEKSASARYRLRQPRALGLIWRASALVPKARGKGAFLSLQLLIGSAALAFYEIELEARTCRLIVLANDHSPLPTAVMFAARRHRIATVYRQHAPVTSAFPPLHVDLALLYDEISCAAYREAARNQAGSENPESAMVILSPFAGSARLITETGRVRTVGICLPLAWEPDPVDALVGELVAGGVEAIVLRAHPASQQDAGLLLRHSAVSQGARGQSVEAFAEAIDLAIVPNSGVCLELMHLGVPTIYRAGMDVLGNDLYGFVEAGILPDWTHRNIAEIAAAASFFDAAWRGRFARFDATQSRTPQTMRNDAVEALNALILRQAT